MNLIGSRIMGGTLKFATLLLCTSTLLAGCATRGHVRTAVQDQAAAQNAALEAERAERLAADQRLGSDVATLRADLTALRNELQSLRTEFGAQIAAVEEGLQFALPVHFGFDDAAVRPQDQAVLERFTQVVNRYYTGAVVTVEGFADPAGSAAYNRRLSQRRAEAVREHLMGLGIQAQLRAVGYGADRLVVRNATKDQTGAELNRRVVFVIESPAAVSGAAVSAGG
jgi:outer membrane protein OmpA-like peptidoglycan-associated protein